MGMGRSSLYSVLCMFTCIVFIIYYYYFVIIIIIIIILTLYNYNSGY